MSRSFRNSNNPSGVQSRDRPIVFCRLLVHTLSVGLWFHQRWNSRRRIENPAHKRDRSQKASRSNVTATVFLEMYVYLHSLRVPWATVVSSRTYELQGVKKLHWRKLCWMSFYTSYLIYLLTATGLTPGGSSTIHIYTQTIHRTTQWNRIHRTAHK